MISDSTTDMIETTTEIEPCKIKKLDPPPCFYLQDVTEKFILYKKCQNATSNRIHEFSKTSKTLIIEDRKCGVVDKSTVETAELCYSSLEEKGISKKKCLIKKIKYTYVPRSTYM